MVTISVCGMGQQLQQARVMWQYAWRSTWQKDELGCEYVPLLDERVV